jgi:hypothetical protein
VRSSINPSKAEWAPVLHAEASSSQASYRFGKVATEVDLDDPDVALWLAEFLCPWFSTEKQNGAALKVSMTSSGEQFSALARAEAKRHPQPLACFRLDRRLVSCPGWSEPDGSIFAADQEFGCYYHVQGNQVEVISRPQDRLARIGLMRVVRELAIPRALAPSETLDLHAAAFVFRGRAILLAGDKNAGKTTLLAHALTSPHTALMANDRTIVDGGLKARGVPTVVSVRAETERAFPALGRIFPRCAARFHQGELTADFRSASTCQLSVLSLSLVQFARQLNSRLEPSAPVGAILFPEISPTVSGWSLEPVDRTEAAARLRGNIYGSALATCTDTIFQRATKALPGSDGQVSLADRMAAVPMIRCLLGKGAYSESSDGWLKNLPIDDGVAPR